MQGQLFLERAEKPSGVRLRSVWRGPADGAPSSRWRPFARGSLAPALLLLVWGSGLLQAAPAQAAKPPNIVFILADDLGYGEVGCYGQKQIPTPNVDRLAAEGMRFTDAYAGSTVCAPSRCVLMTGLHTGHCYVRGNARLDLRPDDVTVAEVLRTAGYATGLAGKWGLGHEGSAGVPTRQGFDAFFGYLDQGHAHNYYPSFLMRGTERVALPNVVPGEEPFGTGVATKTVVYSHDLIQQDALSFIEQHRAGPFFVYLAITLPHVNNERTRATGDGHEVPHYGPFAERDWPTPEKGRAMMIHLMDQCVGEVLKTLSRLGIEQETIVFFSSDNGPQKEGGSDAEFFDSSGPLRGTKRDLYEGGIRVPTIVRWPGRVVAGSASDLAWTFADFLPTAAELAGVTPPNGLDGTSIVPTLLGKPQTFERLLYWEFHEGGFSQAGRRGHWKAVRRRSPKAPLELYDLKTDLGETRNVAADHPELVARFERDLSAARTESAEWPIREPKPRPPRKKKM